MGLLLDNGPFSSGYESRDRSPELRWARLDSGEPVGGRIGPGRYHPRSPPRAAVCRLPSVYYDW
jgi:hypothetical protein